MKHLLTFLRHDVSATLALTVGSPSFDRRYSALKHLAFMLLFLLGSVNVWGADVTFTFNTSEGLNALGITEPNANSQTYISSAISVSPVTITPAKNGATNYPGVFKNSAGTSIDLRLYKYTSGSKGSGVIISVSDGYKLTGISGLWTSKVAASNGTLSSGSWTPANNSTTTSVEIYNNTSGKSGGSATKCTVITISYESTGGGSTKPTVSVEPDGGEFVGSVEVTITPSEGATAYYTTDAEKKNAPSTSTWTLYNGSNKPSFTENKTLYVAAVKDDTWSDVAEKTFTMVEPLTTIQDIFNAATSTATDKYITFSNTWVVTGVSTNGKTAYITDGTKGMILFNKSASDQSPVGGLAVGNTLSGTKQCSLMLYGGAAQIQNFTADGLTKGGNGDLPAVQELDATGISNLSAVNTGSLIKISGQCTLANSKYYIAGVQLYNNLFAFSNPTENANYECTGVYVRYNNINEICPRSAGDLVKKAAKSQANTYWDGAASASLTVRANESVTAQWSTESTGAKHFTSSKESVAIIAADGTITIQGEGTTVLTYTTDENKDYYLGTATLTLTVKAALPTGATEFSWDATAQNYTDQAVMGTVTASPDPIITFVKGGSNDNKWYDNGNAVRFYKDNSITFTAPEGKLLYQIEINFSAGNAQTLVPNVGEYNLVGTIGSWSGLAKSLTLANNASAARITSIIVIYADGTETTLSIANINLKTSDGETALSITKNVDATIIYEDLDENVATISANKVTPVGKGSTTVTARIAQGTNYTAAETTFTITVAEKQIPTMSFPQPSYNANLGETFAAPALTKPEGVSVKYSSNNAAVSVDENTGAITLNAEGSGIVITATSVENDDYAVNTASYTLNVIDPNKDVLTAAGIGKTNYEDWSKSFTTAIVYAGNSTTGTSDNAGAIQMRASSGTQDKSGIVTTSTIGYLKAISATRKSGTNYLDVYAKNTAYESVADLYDAKKCGTLIGSINNGNLVFEEGKGYADHYKYIGIKSHGGAVYYDDITIAWTPAVFEKYSVTYKAGEGSGENVVVSNIEEGTTIKLATKPEGFTYADHAFAGWKLDDAGETLAAGVDYEVNSNVTFVAQWSEAFTITYKAGEGTGDDVVVENVASGAYSLAACPNTFTAPEGKIFAGWKLEDVEEDVRAAGSLYNVSGSVAFVAQWLTANAVTFVAGTDKSESTKLIKSGITITATTFNNDDYYQCYSGNSMTISSEVGEIIKIEITTVARESTKYNASCFSAEGYSYEDVNSTEGVWNGSAESVVFTASAQVRMTQIVVTYIPNGNVPKQPAGLSYETTSYVITQGNPFTAPTLNNPNGLVVTYSGNNDAVATVDENSGAITLGDATGSVTITASAEEQGNYYAGTATYTLTVNEPSDDVTGTWNLVTDAADLMAGMKVIIAQHVNASGTIYTMGKQNSNNRAQVESSVAGETLTPATGTKVLTLVDAGNGKFALQTSDGQYLSAAGTGTNNHLKEAANYNSNQEKWTITIADNKAKIQAASTNRNTIRYNSGNSIFSCYAEDGQADIALYARPFDYSRNVSGNYATICLPKAGQIIGATLYEIAYYGETSKKIFFDEIVNGEMEAGIPYIFQPAAGVEKINVYYSDNTAENVGAGNRNGLIGFYDLNNPAATHYINQDEGYYILYNNQYWLVSGRAAYVENYRAYIQLDQIRPSEPALAPGRRRISMSVNDTQTATGFENVQGDNGQCTKVLINGELFILRGEKMYDAKGQLVK